MSVRQLPLPFDAAAPAAGTENSAVPAQVNRSERPEARAGALFLQVARERRRQNIKGVRVSFRPFRSTLYSFRIKPDGAALLQFHSAFREASDAVLQQAAHLMLCRTRPARRGLDRAAYDAFVRALPPEIFDLPGARRGAVRARPGPGIHRSLDESFHRVNVLYFEGRLAKPKLCWSPGKSRRLLGSYHERTDRMIVSRVFDSARVPLFVLDYLMYHELLHKHLGVHRRGDGRRCVHSPEFRRLERKYIQFEAALAFLKKL
ncbi:MAG: M48 family metallopeptidase [Planctomycetes bacterium]|nr:M48 family metallopeptidase [Planctomycetota bacterium]